MKLQCALSALRCYSLYGFLVMKYSLKRKHDNSRMRLKKITFTYSVPRSFLWPTQLALWLPLMTYNDEFCDVQNSKLTLYEHRSSSQSGKHPKRRSVSDGVALQTFHILSRSDYRAVEPTQRETGRVRPCPMESIRHHFTPSVNTSVYFSKSLAI